MSLIVESCPLTKLNGGLSRLHSADEHAVSWLTSYGSWHAVTESFEFWRAPLQQTSTVHLESSCLSDFSRLLAVRLCTRLKQSWRSTRRCLRNVPGWHVHSRHCSSHHGGLNNCARLPQITSARHCLSSHRPWTCLTMAKSDRYCTAVLLPFIPYLWRLLHIELISYCSFCAAVVCAKKWDWSNPEYLVQF